MIALRPAPGVGEEGNASDGGLGREGFHEQRHQGKCDESSNAAVDECKTKTADRCDAFRE